MWEILENIVWEIVILTEHYFGSEQGYESIDWYHPLGGNNPPVPPQNNLQKEVKPPKP